MRCRSVVVVAVLFLTVACSSSTTSATVGSAGPRPSQVLTPSRPPSSDAKQPAPPAARPPSSDAKQSAPPPARPPLRNTEPSGPPPAPPASSYSEPSAAPPRPALPQPVVIPADDYAPEPVVELGSIEIPAIGLKHRMFQGVTLHNIDKGPSHWTGSALPGEMGNTVFAGHRATNSEPFRRIDALVPGDRVIFTVGSARSTYRVTGHLVVRPADSWIAEQTSAYTGTLYACHPVGSMAERYVVRLELVPS